MKPMPRNGFQGALFRHSEAHGLVSDGRIQSHGRGGTEIGR